jgi:hypothetical protein
MSDLLVVNLTYGVSVSRGIDTPVAALQYER